MDPMTLDSISPEVYLAWNHPTAFRKGHDI